MQLNYDLLRTFSVVARASSFAAAAKQLFITVSAVSQQMTALQAQLGYPLFERVGRRARLTEAGARLAADVGDPFLALDEAIARGTQTQVNGTLTIGAPRAIASRFLLPRILPTLPSELRLRLVFDVASVLEQKLAAGELDACLLAREPETELRATPVLQETFVATASPAYLRKHGTPQTHAEFLTHRYAIFDRDYAMHAPWWRSAFGPKAKPATQIICEAPSLEALLEIAAAGVAIVVLPSYFIDKRVVPIPAGKPASNTIYFCERKRAAPSSKRAWALQLLV